MQLYQNESDLSTENSPEMERPGYYAIIPADVRYDGGIPPNAKLLYGEISALIGKDGFCFASNQYFADIYGSTPKSIQRLITKLEDAGYIMRELEKDKSGKVSRRKIYLSVSVPRIQPVDNFDPTQVQDCPEGGDKIDPYTNTRNTVYKENKKRKSKGEGKVSLTDEELQKLFIEWITEIDPEDWPVKTKNQLYLALVNFYAPRELKKEEPTHTKAGFTALASRLVKLSGGDPQVMIDMLEHATTSKWKSVYAPGGAFKAQATPAADNPGRDGEWL